MIEFNDNPNQFAYKIEFNDDVNEFNRKNLSKKLLSLIKKPFRFIKGKIPSISDDKITLRFVGTVTIIALIISYMVTSAYLMPYVFPKHHNDIFIPNNTDSSYTIVYPKNTPIPTIQPKPIEEVKYFVNSSTPVPVSELHGGIIGGYAAPSIQPITGDDYNHMKASISNMVYTDNLALNIYNQTDLGLMHYHVNDKATITLNIFNRMNEPVTNLKGYITVKSLSTGATLLSRYLIGNIDCNVQPQENYLSSYNFNIPNFKGNYGITLEAESNNKKGFGIYWEVDIL